jgi:hypothetical protein
MQTLGQPQESLPQCTRGPQVPLHKIIPPEGKQRLRQLGGIAELLTGIDNSDANNGATAATRSVASARSDSSFASFCAGSSSRSNCAAHSSWVING